MSNNTETSAEQWKTIPGVDPVYEASNLGRVRSKGFDKPRKGGGRFRSKPRILKEADRGNGYAAVSVLNEEGRRVQVSVSRVVALAHLPPPEKGKEFVLHRDGNPTNNKADNLYWGDNSDNMKDRTLHGRDPNRRKTHCPQGHPYDEENTYRNSKGHRLCTKCTRQRAEKRRKDGLPDSDPRHGTLTGYMNWNCRCGKCRGAGAKFTASRPKKENNPVPCGICGKSVTKNNLSRHEKSRNCSRRV